MGINAYKSSPINNGLQASVQCLMFEFSAQTTLGMALDDPSDVKQLSRKLTFHFQKAAVAL